MSEVVSSFDAELESLRALSGKVGSNALLTQGAGGNTSIKNGGLLWIKASGKWLANAAREEMFVPVRQEQVLNAVSSGSSDAEKPELFVDQLLNSSRLRPSIETTVHALMPQKVVVHVHCVNTIALAVQENAAALADKCMVGFNYAFIPYARPGLPLARAIAARLSAKTDVLILGNHGLVVAAATVEEAETLLEQVTATMTGPARNGPPGNLPELMRLAMGSDYRLPSDARAHGAATDQWSIDHARAGSLYPDHVVFLGKGSKIAKPGETAASIAAAAAGANLPSPVSVLFPDVGVLMRGDASPGADAMAGCLADVLSRITQGAKLRYLTEAEHGELLNWDAEKYRQKLNHPRGAQL